MAAVCARGKGSRRHSASICPACWATWHPSCTSETEVEENKLCSRIAYVSLRWTSHQSHFYSPCTSKNIIWYGRFVFLAYFTNALPAKIRPWVSLYFLIYPFSVTPTWASSFNWVAELRFEKWNSKFEEWVQDGSRNMDANLHYWSWKVFVYQGSFPKSPCSLFVLPIPIPCTFSCTPPLFSALPIHGVM